MCIMQRSARIRVETELDSKNREPFQVNWNWRINDRIDAIIPTSMGFSQSLSTIPVCGDMPGGLVAAQCGLALDGLEYNKRHVQNLQDLCSRYKFVPLTTDDWPCVQEVAGHLSRHFCGFGPPLFLKRDNGGNLNHRSVNDLLEEWMVIPVNSPPYTAPYNGSIEHGQEELKKWLRKWSSSFESKAPLAPIMENAVHALNHRPRRSLHGKNACRSYFSSSRMRYDKRKRKEVYDWIRDLAVDIWASCGKNKIDPAALATM